MSSVSSKSAYIDVFNEKVDEFIRNLIKSFPEVKQFSQFKAGFMLLRNMDKYKPQEFFNTYIYSLYGENLMKKEEEFFLNHDYNVDTSNVESTHREYWQDFIECIRNVWVGLDPDNKEVIWKYFFVLIALNQKCIS